MSTVFVEQVEIGDVLPHPNADRLEIVQVKGTQVVTLKGQFKAGDWAAYFPPDIMIPEDVADRLGVKQYLKHAEYEPGQGSSQCRVAACRLRGQPSYGFLTDDCEVLCSRIALGHDIGGQFRARKYEPPVRETAEDAARDDANFHKYTSIEHYWRNTDEIIEGTPVRITEKIHGTNSRVGVVKLLDGTFEFMAGSHKLRRKKPEEGHSSLYWSPLENDRVLSLLNHLCDEQHTVIIFGEIFGKTVQDMDYGEAGATGYRVFDISVDGRYLDWAQIAPACLAFGVPTVPVLYVGPFSKELVEKYTHGETTLADKSRVQSRFKGREGIVITPLVEQHSRSLGRVILKSVSADYLDRKGAQDNE